MTISIKRRANGKKGNASLCVTNKRLVCSYERTGLFFGRSANKSVYQMNIKDVGDISLAAVRKTRFAPILLILLGLITLILIIGFIFLILGIVWLMLSPPSKGVKFSSKGGSGGGMGTGFYIIARRRLTAGITDFNEMASEIGALIADLQAYGDECIPYWNSQISQ